MAGVAESASKFAGIIRGDMSSWTLLSRSEIDDQKWNNTVINASNEHIYGYSFYLDIVAKNWSGLVFGNYEAILPVIIKSKLGVKYLGQINHVQRLNVFTVFPTIPQLMELEELILKPVSYLDIVFEKQLISSFSSIEKTNLILPLNKTFETLKKEFKTNTKRGIKKAENFDAKFNKVPNNLIDEAVKLFQLQKDFGLNKSWFKDLVSISKNDFSELYSVMLEKEHIAFALILISKKRVTLIFTALGEKGKEIGAMPFLISELIRNFSNSDKILDFEGSENPGTARFYSSFGATTENYYHYQSDGLLKRTKELFNRK